MGACCTSAAGCCTGCCTFNTGEDTDRNRAIGSFMDRGVSEEKRTMRVLILGTGDSGKTTLLKQMRKIYSTISEAERQDFATPIAEAIVFYIKTLCQMSALWKEKRPQCQVKDKELQHLADQFCEQISNIELAIENVDVFKALWNDEGLQNVFSFRNEYPMAENVPYFFSRIEDVARSDYLPTWDDYIRFRMRTTGQWEESFSVTVQSHGHYHLKVTDVGGQKAERKKWWDLFTEANVHGVIYVVSANGYDTVLFEEAKENRWRDSLQLFEKLAKKGMFSNRSVILFFNKHDIFVEKIKKVPVTVEFKEEFDADDSVTDPNDEEDVLNFLFNMFLAIYKAEVETESRLQSIHFHPTTCLKTDLVERLLANIQNDLVRNRLVKTHLF